MQVTIDIDQDLWQAAKKKAQFQQTSMDKALIQLLRRGLAAEDVSQAATPFTFSLPGGAVTNEDVNAVLEDEDE